MRVVVTGATGNVGTSVVAALAGDPGVDEIIGVARRVPQQTFPRTAFVAADVVTTDLAGVLRGADVVVHLAWLIQPGRDESATYAVNVRGSERVFAATVQAKVPTLVYASSVGAYSPGPKDRRVDESWPTDQPGLRVVRMRPGLIFKAEAATEIRRLFAGPFLPAKLLAPGAIPFVPDVPRLRFQAVHSDDVGDAYRRALFADVRGPFNLAAEPVIDPAQLARLLGARKIKLPASLLRAGAAATFALHLQPTSPGWVDMALAVPLMDAGRAQRELGWTPAHSATDALLELIEGMRAAADFATPPLSRQTSGPARIRELLTGLGRRP